MVKGNDVELLIDHKIILEKVNFHIPKGRITVFMGPSGAGKTSLLKCIANLYSHYSGSLLFDRSSIKQLSAKERAHSLGFIFQQFNLFGHMTVLQNCSYPIKRLFECSQKQAELQAMQTLNALSMADYKDSYPSKLSGGQQQRVAIARALCLEPKLLLFDEPSSALDPQSTLQLAQLLKKLRDDGITIVVSSHDVSLVRVIANRLNFLKNGKIKPLDDLRLVNSNIDEYIADFFL